MNFELDGYAEALKEFPSSKARLRTKKGTAKFVKLDVFKRRMFYFNSEDPTSELLEITIEGAKQIIELNKKGQTPEGFDQFVVECTSNEARFEDAVGQDNINRFDIKRAKKEKNWRRQKRAPKNKKSR